MGKEKKLNVFFIPFFASGHMLPMADLAALFARRPNVTATLCLTPANAAFLQPTLDPKVKVLTYPFPSEAVGLPSGVENISSINNSEEEYKIYVAVGLSEPTQRRLLKEHRPDAIIDDYWFSWNKDVALELGVPRIIWHAIGVFPQLVLNSLNDHVHEISKDKDTVVKVKDLPGNKDIRMPVSELPEMIQEQIRNPDQHLVINKFWNGIRSIQLESYGTVTNTVYGIEPAAYCDHYRENECKKAWFVGPVALARGRSALKQEQRHQCLEWLDGKEEGSVVFVCFGSWCKFEDEQLKEMANGLEHSGRSFLWVVRKGWMPDEEWKERVGDRGKVVGGWVPQVAVLEHKAVGLFFTHCGWNSVLEAMAAGVPMLTWPLVFEQFINERLMVDVVEAAMPVFDGFRSTRAEDKIVVPGRVIGDALSSFMEEEEGEGGRRKMKARECAEIAKMAVAEGGSSWNDLNSLIDELLKLRM